MIETALKKEHNAVLEMVKITNKGSVKLIEVLEDKTTNWIEVLGYLCYHRVAGLAYDIVNSVNVRKLDFPVFFTLYMIHQSQKIRTEVQKQYIKNISLQLNKSNIEHVFLKGSVLSSTIYPTGTRSSNDIDILVSRKSIQKVKKLLLELDFVQGIYDFEKNTIKEFDQQTIIDSINKRGEMAPFVKIVNKTAIKTVDVDVNFSMHWLSNDTDEAVSYFLKNRILIPFDTNFSVYSLKKEHLFTQLCSHIYKDSVILDIVKKRKVLDLYKFVDIYVFIIRYFKEIDIEKIFQDSIKYSFDRQVFFTLNYVAKIFPEILDIENVKLLYQKYNYLDDDNTVIIYDQYNPKNKMEDNGSLIDRLFSYDVIKKFK